MHFSSKKDICTYTEEKEQTRYERKLFLNIDTYRWTERGIDRHTDRWIDRQKEEKIDRKVDE